MLFTFQTIAIFLTIIFLPAVENEWKLELNKNDISVYTRKCEDSRFKEFLATTEIQGTVEAFSAIIMDSEAFPNWIPDCKAARIIERPNKNEVLSHIKMEVPFPFTDRDMVQKFQLISIEQGVRVIVSSEPDLIEEIKNYVRMPFLKGSWTVKQIASGKISVHFQCLSDPGGGLPPWLVNTFLVKNPYETLFNLRKMMESGGS